MSQVLSQIVPVALLSIPVAPALSFDFLRHDGALLVLREFLGSFAPFVLGIGVSLYVFYFRHRRGSKSG
ncbi:MAG: hypothetical protein IT481_07900 [Gammaproteobacteria bacterium]|jgi:hypothetical protein|nr:hypothetical protein [Gammaproteobacteria bacterium]